MRLRITRRPRLLAMIGLPCIALSACEDRAAHAPPRPAPTVVTVSRPLTRDVTDALEYTGTLAALQSVEVRARVTGFLDKLHVEPRAKVKKDEVLFTIDPRSFQNELDAAKANLELKKAQLEKAEFTAKKTEENYKQGVASEQELVDALANRNGLRAGVAAAEAAVNTAQLNRDWCSVQAPLDGRISRNLVDSGNVIVADSTVLANIVNDESVYVYFNASEQDILRLRDRFRAENPGVTSLPGIREMRWPFQLGLMTEDGYPHDGVLDYSAPELDASTGTQQVRGVIPNQDGRLLPGLFARVRVPIGDPYQALLVTERALGSDQGQRYLLTVNDKNIVEYRPVKVGTLQDGLRVIVAGLSATDRVIVNGMQRVRPGATVKPEETSMPVRPAEDRGRAAPSTGPAAAGQPARPE